MRRVGVTLAAIILVVACSPAPTSAPPSITSSPAPTTAAPTTVPTPVPGATQGADGACTASQVQATPRESGAAAGTSYLAVTLQLVEGAACSLPRGPNIALTSGDGTVLVHGTDANPAPILLRDTLLYRIGWNVGCGQTVPGPTLAAIELYGAAVITMPIGDFGPTCADGSTGNLFMDVDAP